MPGISHLTALNTRLHNERQRLAASKSAQEAAIRRVWIAAIEREIVHEMDFLSGEADDEIAAMDDDALMAALFN